MVTVNEDFRQDVQPEFHLRYNECLESLQQLGSDELTWSERREKNEEFQEKANQLNVFITSVPY